MTGPDECPLGDIFNNASSVKWTCSVCLWWPWWSRSWWCWVSAPPWEWSPSCGIASPSLNNAFDGASRITCWWNGDGTGSSSKRCCSSGCAAVVVSSSVSWERGRRVRDIPVSCSNCLTWSSERSNWCCCCWWLDCCCCWWCSKRCSCKCWGASVSCKGLCCCWIFNVFVCWGGWWWLSAVWTLCKSKWIW